MKVAFLVRLAISMIVLTPMFGCASFKLMPRSEDVTIGDVNWKSYAEGQQFFDNIEVGKTTIDDMAEKGLNLTTAKNVRKLSRPSLSLIFVQNVQESYNNLPESVKNCLRYDSECVAYQFHKDSTKESSKESIGRLAMRLLKFKEESTVYSWHMDMLILVSEGKVVYKHIEGTPNGTERRKSHTRPLGPIDTIRSRLNF